MLDKGSIAYHIDMDKQTIEEYTVENIVSMPTTLAVDYVFFIDNHKITQRVKNTQRPNSDKELADFFIFDSFTAVEKFLYKKKTQIINELNRYNNVQKSLYTFDKEN